MDKINEFRAYIRRILENALQTEQEKEPEDAEPATPADAPEEPVEEPADEPEEEPIPEPEMPDEPESDSEEADETGESLYTVETMIKLFNTIRSGMSMKDDNVVKALDTWWDKESIDDLKKFLYMLANIAKAVIEDQDNPEEAPVEDLASNEPVEPAETEAEPTPTEPAPEETSTGDDEEELDLASI